MVGINLGIWSLRIGEEDAVAIEDASRCFSYKEARSGVARIAAGLYSAGVRPGDGVAFLLPNSVRAALGIFGIWAAGASVVSLRTPLTNYEILRCLDIWPVKWALTSLSHADRFRECPNPIRVLDIDEIERGGDSFVAPAVPLDTPALALFTSGTTGEPKAVIHSARSLASQTARMAPYRAANNSSAASGINTTLQTLQAGGTQIFLDESAMGSKLAKALLDHRADQVRLPPNSLMSLVESKQRLGPSVRRLISGGDFISADFQRRASDVLGLPIIQVYGATEAFAMTRGNEETPLGSIGRTLPQVELQLRSEEDGSVVSGAGQGLAWVRSPKLFVGYGSRGTIQRPLDENGWFKTGDVLKRDGDGNYYFLLRVSNYLKINTVKVSSREIESVFLRDAVVKNAHSVCLNLSGERDILVVALEVERPDPNIGGRLNSLMNSYLARFKHPEAIYTTTTFPYSRAGKIDARALEALILSGQLPRVIPAS